MPQPGERVSSVVLVSAFQDWSSLYLRRIWHLSQNMATVAGHSALESRNPGNGVLYTLGNQVPVSTITADPEHGVNGIGREMCV